MPEAVYSDGAASIKADFKRDRTFWRYMPTAQYVGEDKAVYFSNEEAAVAYANAHSDQLGTKEISEYNNGVGYYNVWLRHANDENVNHDTDHAEMPMHLGIVINNIYHVAFSFRGHGDPKTEIHEPHDIDFRIFVRKRNLRTHPEIIM